MLLHRDVGGFLPKFGLSFASTQDTFRDRRARCAKLRSRSMAAASQRCATRSCAGNGLAAARRGAVPALLLVLLSSQLFFGLRLIDARSGARFGVSSRA